MTRIHRPGLPRWRCTICEAPTDQRHHIDYRTEGRWALMPLCDDHHARLHRVYEKTEGVPLAVVTAQFVADPEAAEGLARVVPLRQLSFADQATPQGEHWRAVEDLWGEILAELWDDAA